MVWLVVVLLVVWISVSGLLVVMCVFSDLILEKFMCMLIVLLVLWWLLFSLMMVMFRLWVDIVVMMLVCGV